MSRLCVDLDLRNPLAEKAIRNRLTKVKGVNATIRARLRSQLEKSLKLGESIDEAAARVKRVFQNARSSVHTIARTEINAAASDATRIQADRTFGDAYETEWISSRDFFVRESHANVDGVRIKAGETYPNGLARPHDPNGPAKEVINCRCVEMIHPIDGPEMLPSVQDAPASFTPTHASLPPGGIRDVFTDTLLKTPGAGGLPQDCKIAIRSAAAEIQVNQPLTDPRIFTELPLKRMQVLKGYPNWDGAYFSGMLDIRLKPSPSYVTVLHEYGHHVDYRFYRYRLTGAGAPKLSLTKESAKLRIEALNEFRDAQEYANKTFLQGQAATGDWLESGLWDKHKKTLYKYAHSLRGISAYAHGNEKEWFAEHFARYFTTPDRVKQVAPKTYGWIDKLVKGELFKGPTPLPKIPAAPSALDHGISSTGKAFESLMKNAGGSMQDFPKELKRKLEKCFGIMQKSGLDVRIPNSAPFSKITRNMQNKELRGAYYRAAEVIELGPDVGKVRWHTFAHEYGHHMNSVFFGGGTPPIPLRIGTATLRQRMLDEFSRARLHAAQFTMKPLETMEAVKELMAVEKKLNTVAAYALTSEEEWFAEAYRWYVRRPQFLKLKSPDTFEFIDRLSRGKLFKAQ